MSHTREQYEAAAARMRALDLPGAEVKESRLTGKGGPFVVTTLRLAGDRATVRAALLTLDTLAEAVDGYMTKTHYADDRAEITIQVIYHPPTCPACEAARAA